MVNNKDWTGNSSIYACNHRSKESEVATNDFYSTHPESVQLFLKKCKERNFVLPDKIWECAAGDGAISKILEAEGHTVLSTDLIGRGYGEGDVNFLTITTDNLPNEYKPYCKCIMTNPPYSYSREFVEKSLELLDNDGICIMFLKLTFLETKKRKELFNNGKLKHVWVHVNRQACGKNGGTFKNGSSATCYAWFIWDNTYNGLPQIDWID